MSQTGGYGTGSRRAARRSGASFGGTQESLSSAPMAYISGKQAFLEILKSEGFSFMFGNPGPTELPLMDGLAREPAIHYVLALQEAVAIAAADGYAQARGGLAAVNVHVTPGLGNAMGMLYDAQKSGAPLVLTAGQHDQSFTVTEPILWADLPPIARPFVKWSTEARRLEDLPRIVRRAAKTALARPSGPVFLALAELVELAELCGAPVLSEGVSSTCNVPFTHPLYAGAMPRLGPLIREILMRHDLLFSVGGDLFTLSLPDDVDPMPPGVDVVHLDVDPWELGKNYPARVAIQGDPKATLPELAEALRRHAGRAGA